MTKKTVEVTFPKEYHADTLAGKDAKFEVKIHEVQEAVPFTEANDALAEKLNFATMEDLRDALKKQLQAEADELSYVRVKKGTI